MRIEDLFKGSERRLSEARVPNVAFPSLLRPSHLVLPVLSGIAIANRSYRKWSDGYWLCDAGIENVMQTYVAEACHRALKNSSLRVHPEGLYSYFYEIDNDTRRADILITCKKEIPRVHIELKRNADSARNDGERIAEVMTSEAEGCQKLTGAIFGAFVGRPIDKEPAGIAKYVLDAFKRFEIGLAGAPLRVKPRARSLGSVKVRTKTGDYVTWQAAALAVTITRNLT